jgi:SAM-dependent methyltransferase
MAVVDNHRIWEHYQNARQDAFEGSKPRLAFVLRQIKKRATGIPSVLNIGAGDGYFERLAQAAGWDIHSVDPDERAIAALAIDGIRAHVGTIQRIPAAAASLDFVVATEVLEHLTETQGRDGLAEIARVLKPGGYFVGTVPHDENLVDNQAICPHCGEVFHRWGHQRSFTMASAREMLSAHFAVDSLGRNAFVDLRRSLKGFLKGAFRIALAKIGEPIAVPTIWWVARK